MSYVYDNWDRLVSAVLNREHLREIALRESFDTSISDDFSSRSSFDFPVEDISASSISSKTITLGATSTLVEYIEFEELQKATNNFRAYSSLGEEGFGHFSKGWIDEHTLTASKAGSGTAVAVKIWNQGHQAIKECLKEINYLNLFRHPNLVKLIGYCSDKENMILVYEFVPKGSLNNHLFGGWRQSLSWVTRLKVAVGAARGLVFLHENEKPVIHRDFRSSCILLDGEFNAKLSGFSLATYGPTGDMTHVSTQVMGTYGYAAPEYLATGHLTAKCDVYGFGVVLLEILSGRRVVDMNRPSEEQNLVEWAKPYLHEKRKLLRIMDPKLEGQYTHKAAYTVATIALQCINPYPRRRPRMVDVLAALEQI